VQNPEYVFLDQNHWIYLAKDFWGKPHKPAHAGISEGLLARVERDQIRLPLNVIHLIELLRHESPDKRERLARVFELFSRGWFFAAWADIIPIEIARAVAQTFDPASICSSPEVFGRGVLFGIGARGRKELLNGRADANLRYLSWFAAQPGALLDLLTYPNEGGRCVQKQRISELGARDAAAAEVLRIARKPSPKPVHRRAQYAGYTADHLDQIVVDLRAVGRSVDDFMALGADGLTEFWSRVPSLDADCELTLYRDRQWPRAIHPNDIRDLGHLALAIPYCSTVVVERFWARAIQETGLAKKYGVAVCADLSELAAAVSGCE
jgi:hypothetical protein